MDLQSDETVYPQDEAEPTSPPAEDSLDASVGAVQVRLALDLPAGEYHRITVETLSGEEDEAQAAPLGTVLVHPSGRVDPISGSLQPVVLPVTAGGTQSRWNSLLASLPEVLFVLSLLVYLATRLIGLADFPIYFFTDEAAQTVLAADLVRDGLHGWEGDFLPTYFKNGSYYNLSASVYLQVLPYLLFGKSVLVTRGVPVFVSLLAAVSVGLILRDFWKTPYWWSGVLLLSITPAWFLHSRTAFETVVFVSFYAGMLYTYLLYRLRSPSYLYLTVILAALAFYSYSPGQVIVGASGALLLLSDVRYHWQNRGIVLRNVFLAGLLTLPYLRFRLEQPAATFVHLRLLNSYWVQPLPLEEKLSRFIAIYLDGLSPGYWFTYHLRDLPRHVMKDYGHLLRPTLLFALLGLVIALSRVRRSEYRVVLIALLAGPLGSALVEVGITRLLVLVIPAALLIALGISTVLGFLERPADVLRRLRSHWLERWKLPQSALSIALFVILTVVNAAILRDSLVNGPTWYQNYDMGGMQYGARQAFAAAQEYLERRPETEIIFSPTWTNGTDVLARFFLGDPLPLQLGSIQGHIDRPLPLNENTLFVTTPEEYQHILESARFSEVQVEQILPYPNGEPGFYFVRLRYAPDAQSQFAAEATQRVQLQQAEVQLGGQPLRVRYSPLDMGEIYQAFDDDPFTFIRTLEANPLVVEVDFPGVRQMNGLSLIIGSADVEIAAQVSASQDGPSRLFSTWQIGSVENPEVHLDFGEVVDVQHIRIEVLDQHQPQPAHIHVWEIYFLGEYLGE